MSDTFISLKPKRDVALFDLDGTVLDTYAPILESMRYATKTVFGEALPDSKLVSMVGQPLVTQMQAFAAERGCGSEVADELTRVYREYNERDLDEKSFPFPGIPEAIASLKNAGFTVGVVTSKRAVLATKSLKAHRLFDAFACVNGAEDSTAHKPDPDPLLTAAKNSGFRLIDACMWATAPTTCRLPMPQTCHVWALPGASSSDVTSCSSRCPACLSPAPKSWSVRLNLPQSIKVKAGRAVFPGFCCIVALRLHAVSPFARADLGQHEAS